MHCKSDLHEYQQAAIDYLYEHDRSLALMPVGSGKSISALTALLELMADSVIKRPFVFAPLRVAQLVWGQERFEWDHTKNMEMVLWGGEPSSWPESPWKTSRILWGRRTHMEQRIPKIEDVQKRRVQEAKLAELLTEERRVNKTVRATEPPACIHVTSYENALWFCELYEPGTSPFDAFVFDELGKIKNPKSPRYKALRKHTKLAKMVIGLNATPAPESFMDLFSQVQIVDGGRLWGASFYSWRQKFFTPADYSGYSWRMQLGAQERLMADLNTVAFRVDEEQLSYKRSIQHSQILVEMPPKAREAYREMEKTMALEIDGGDDIVAMSAAAASMKLRQLTNGFIYSDDGKVHILHEEKAHALADLIDAMGREPLLVGYEFSEDLDAIRRVWRNVPYLGQGVSATAARDAIDKWNRRELPVLALHPLSAGHGLNLQKGGSHIAWYSLPWPLESYLQTNGRIDRQGQTRACFGHHIVVKDSMDQRISDALIRKDVDQSAIIAAIRRV